MLALARVLSEQCWGTLQAWAVSSCTPRRLAGCPSCRRRAIGFSVFGWCRLASSPPPLYPIPTGYRLTSQAQPGPGRCTGVPRPAGASRALLVCPADLPKFQPRPHALLVRIPLLRPSRALSLSHLPGWLLPRSLGTYPLALGPHLRVWRPQAR